MSNNKLLKIEPLELQFPFQLKKRISCSLHLTNKTDNHVAFKVWSTNSEKYDIKPNIGVVLPRSTCEVRVTMHAQEEAPSDLQCKDKFLLQSVITNSDFIAEEVINEMLSKETGHVVEETNLGVAYSTVTTPCTNQLLTIEPLDLKFRVVFRKMISRNIFLTNKTDNNVAIKIRATNPRNYLSSCAKGVVLPRSTSIISVVMRAQEEALPSEQQSSDKFIIKAIASPGITEDEVTYDMFNEEAGNLVEESILSVTFSYPNKYCICL